MRRNISSLTAGLVVANFALVIPVFASTAEFTRHYDLGEDFLARDQYKLAIPEFDVAIKSAQNQKSDIAKALVQRGTAYSALKKYDQALADLDRALTLEPDNDLGLNNRGAVYLRTRQSQKAVADFDRAIKLNPDNKYAVVNRAGAIMMEPDPSAKMASTMAWLDAGKHWQSDFAGHAAVLVTLSRLVSKDRAGFNNMVDISLKKLDRLKWPFALFQYFKGKKTVEEVLESAEDSTYNLMQAQCFLAIESYTKGDLDQAMTRLDFVTRHGTVNSVEYWLGQDFIARIKERRSHTGKPNPVKVNK